MNSFSISREEHNEAMSRVTAELQAQKRMYEEFVNVMVTSNTSTSTISPSGSSNTAHAFATSKVVANLRRSVKKKKAVLIRKDRELAKQRRAIEKQVRWKF